jgi:hypothetical protein
LALLGAWLSGFGGLGAAIVAAKLGYRLVLQRQVDHTLRLEHEPLAARSGASLLAFVVYGARFLSDAGSWRGLRYQVRAEGTLVFVVESKA